MKNLRDLLSNVATYMTFLCMAGGNGVEFRMSDLKRVVSGDGRREHIACRARLSQNTAGAGYNGRLVKKK